MATRKIVSQIDGINNIRFSEVYDNTKISQTFSENNGSYQIDENLTSNEISDNTISPPRPTTPYAYHPTLINRCTFVNTYINNGLYVPYVSESLQLKPPSIEEIYYKT
jgi:hypothetical protein